MRSPPAIGPIDYLVTARQDADSPLDAMTYDLDIYRTAAIFVKEHSEDAPIHAAMRADELLDESDANARNLQLQWRSSEPVPL